MQRLVTFMQLSLDGCYADAKSDMSWAHRHDEEFNAFSADQAKGNGTLLFGRKTYELMIAYWPTPAAAKNNPKVAEGINRAPKVVFSRTLDKATWQNTRVVKSDLASEVRKMKNGSGEGMVILGSGSIVTQLADEGLIDEFQLVMNPILLGSGKRICDGLKEKLGLKLTKTRAFRNGNIFASYEVTSK